MSPLANKIPSTLAEIIRAFYGVWRRKQFSSGGREEAMYHFKQAVSVQGESVQELVQLLIVTICVCLSVIFAAFAVCFFGVIIEICRMMITKKEPISRFVTVPVMQL
ncbi:hypothetical protein QR680_015764 [Steinernema hermaphroditum]|uniref:Uncharacterized protein n=1 Tax=Steinernema hermaphroditum TaxID=289476 RepID=A0AA39LLA9_9BILA|nr:hypothetical protein QR680_015764 [Steinernema hermaphroditum]